MAPIVLLLSGPNLRLLGERQPEVYGTATLADHVGRARSTATGLGLELEHFQSDAFEGPVVELHLSNPDAREPFRHTSVLSPVVSGAIVGFGALGYELAVKAVASMLQLAA
jgi:3-dehydroquinate dehydratase-2